MVVIHPASHLVFEVLRDEDLVVLPLLAVGQLERDMLLALGTLTA